MALSRGLRLQQYLDNWLIRSQSQEEAQVNTQAVVDLTQSLGWIINQEKSELKSTQVFSFVGYEYHLDSALVKPTQERWLKLQDLILRLKSKHVLIARCLNGENGPGGTPSHEALSVSSQGALEISSVAGQPPSLDRNHFCTPRLVAEPHKHDERCRPSSQRPQHPTVYRRLKRRLGRSLRSNFYKGAVVRQGKKATHKCSRVEGGLPGPSKLQGPVSEPSSASCNGQLNSGSLHKQTRRNSLSGDVRAPVEDHDMMPSLSHNIESQTHFRVSECDGRPSVQVEPSTTEWSLHPQVFKQICQKWFTSSCRSICHSSEPQTSTVCVSSPRSKGLGHRCSEPSDGSTSQGDPKNQAMPLPDHRNSPRLARDALVMGPSAALNRDPTANFSVNNSSQTVPQLCVPQQSTASQPPCLGVDSSKNKASLWSWQRELLPLRGHQQGPSTSQSGPYLRNGAEKIRWISLLHL